MQAAAVEEVQNRARLGRRLLVVGGADARSRGVRRPILTHGAMAPATLYISKAQGSASHPAWASQGAKTVKFRISLIFA